MAQNSQSDHLDDNHDIICSYILFLNVY